MLPRDLGLVGADERAVPHDVGTGDEQPVDAVRPREDQTGDRIRGARELEPVGTPHREVGPLPGLEAPDVVASEGARTTSCGKLQGLAR